MEELFGKIGDTLKGAALGPDGNLDLLDGIKIGLLAVGVLTGTWWAIVPALGWMAFDGVRSFQQDDAGTLPDMSASPQAMAGRGNEIDGPGQGMDIEPPLPTPNAPGMNRTRQAGY